jgi:hypothetical protein
MTTNATYGTEAARLVGLDPTSLANSNVTLFVPTDEVSTALSSTLSSYDLGGQRNDTLVQC